MDRVLPRPLDLQWRWIANAAAVALLMAWWAWLVGSMDALPSHTDARAYWSMDIAHPYDGTLGGELAFLYSPVVAQVLHPFTLLPFEAFYAVLSAASLGALVWMLGPILALGALFLPPVSHEIGNGNIHLLLAAAIVAGVRSPGWWAFPLLTKITPGVGVLWHAFRGEWRAVGIAAATTLLLVGLSAMLVPMLWVQWIGVLMDSDRTTSNVYVMFAGWSLGVRLALAVGLVWLAARIDRPALLPVACLIALPAVWINALAMLVAAWPLLVAQDRQEQA